METILRESDPAARPLWLVAEDGLTAWLDRQPATWRTWLQAGNFRARPGSIGLLPGADGDLAGAVVGVAANPDMWALADLSSRLPGGRYRLQGELAGALGPGLALGWALGGYRFERYAQAPETAAQAQLMLPPGADGDDIENAVRAVFLARDLINTPAEDMGPDALAQAALDLAAETGAAALITVGDDLLAANHPMIHAVGRAAARPPRLIDLTWGDGRAPKVTLVGKGVCFDSGGLDLKSASGMELMKKDMGGAAAVLGVAAMVMRAGLPVRLRVLIPAVENAVAGNAMRPGDVLRSRAGHTVEIGNTDAEGRLVLADALAAAGHEAPDLVVDVATLTGAARVAVGTEIAALFTADDALADDLVRLGRVHADPVWRLPLWQPYRALIDSKIANLNNAGEGRYAGATTAALFLKEFIGDARSWAHLDVMAWNTKARPGRPVGGEAFAVRALFHLIRERFGAGGSSES